MYEKQPKTMTFCCLFFTSAEVLYETLTKNCEKVSDIQQHCCCIINRTFFLYLDGIRWLLVGNRNRLRLGNSQKEVMFQYETLLIILICQQ